MRIGSHDKPSGSRESLFHHDLVADSAFSDFVVIFDVVFGREFPHFLGLFGGKDVFIGNIVVGDQDQAVPVYLFGTEFFEFPERYGPRHVVDHHVVHFGYDYLSGTCIGAGFFGEYLLCDCFSHFISSF